MTSEQLNKILTTKSYDYKFINRNSKDKLIVSVNGLGVNKIAKSLKNKDEFKAQGNSVFDMFDDLDILEHSDYRGFSGYLEFYKTLTENPICSDADILFLADGKWSFYFSGIDGIAKNVDEIKDFIHSLIINKGYKSVYFIGTCSGAWLIALQTLSLQLIDSLLYIKALLFNPLNDVFSSGHLKSKKNFMLSEEMTDKVNIHDYNKQLNIDTSLIKARIEFTIYYSMYNKTEKEQALLYKDMENDKMKVDLIGVKTDLHNVAEYLKFTNELNDILINFLK